MECVQMCWVNARSVRRSDEMQPYSAEHELTLLMMNRIAILNRIAIHYSVMMFDLKHGKCTKPTNLLLVYLHCSQHAALLMTPPSQQGKSVGK